jgi:hypothetical protein
MAASFSGRMGDALAMNCQGGVGGLVGVGTLRTGRAQTVLASLPLVLSSLHSGALRPVQRTREANSCRSLVRARTRRVRMRRSAVASSSFGTVSGIAGEGAYDVLGLGQAMVDFSASVTDGFLGDLAVEKGGRR